MVMYGKIRRMFYREHLSIKALKLHCMAGCYADLQQQIMPDIDLVSHAST